MNTHKGKGGKKPQFFKTTHKIMQQQCKTFWTISFAYPPMEDLFQRDNSEQTQPACKHRNTGIAVLDQINSSFSSVTSHLTAASIRCFGERMKKSPGGQLQKKLPIKFLSNSHHLLDGLFPVTGDFSLSLFVCFCQCE